MSDVIRTKEGREIEIPNFTFYAANTGRFSIHMDEPKSSYPKNRARVIDFSLKNNFAYAEMQKAFAAFADEDLKLANAGIEEYRHLLDLEDRTT